MSVRQSSPHRVGLNAHLLALSQTYRGAGINNYIEQLLRHLPGADGGFAYTAYLHDERFRAPTGMAVCRSRWDTARPWRRIAWEQTRLAVLSASLDLLHGLAYATPLAARCPTVVTVHDLSFLRFPETLRPFNRYYLGLMTRAATRRAVRVIADSESTRQDVIALCGVPADRVITVHIGVAKQFCPAGPDAVADFRRRPGPCSELADGLPEHFILFVGTLEPRKNLVRLIEAYAGWRQAADRPAKLVIAGGKGWYYERIFARVQELGLTGEVIFPGYLPAAALPWWYRAADLFVYPSVFEGFGLPVLEAMACGTPVITSSASSLPEVAGKAALLVNPDDTGAWANAISRVLAEPAFAAELREAGLQQAARFSWQQTAADTVAVYRAALGL